MSTINGSHILHRDSEEPSIIPFGKNTQRSAESTLTDLLSAMPNVDTLEASVTVPEQMARSTYEASRLKEAHSWASLGLQQFSDVGSSLQYPQLISGSLHCTLSAVLLEWNQLHEAHNHAQIAVNQLEGGGSERAHANALLQLAATSAALGNYNDVRARLDDANQAALLASMDDESIRQFTRRYVSILLDCGDARRAQHTLSSLQRNRAMDPEDEALSLRALLSQGRIEGCAERGIRLLKTLKADATVQTRIDIGAISATALDSGGRRTEALVILSTTVQLGQTERFIHSIARHGPIISPLLQALRARSTMSEHTWSDAYLDQLISASASSPQLAQSTEIIDLNRSYEALTPRELQVLRLLGGNLSNREIGNELYLSVNTVKTHVKSVYAKLGVNRRSEAVNRGRKLGLLNSAD